MAELRALVVGLGSIGQRHARNLRALGGDGVVLSALRQRRGSQVVGDDLALGEGDVERDFDGGVFTNLDEALATSPDVVVVANPSALHVPVTEAAVRAGAAVLVEKPVSDRLDGLEGLLDEIAARDAVVMVGCQLRFHPALRDLESLLARDAVGELVAVHVEQAEYLPSFHPYEDYRASYAARRDLGGGVVLTQIHELDYLRWLFGDPRSVFAVGGHLSGLEIDVEDSASALLANERHGRPLAVHLHLDYLQRPPRRTCRVVGESGTIELDLRAPRLEVRDGGGTSLLRRDYPDFSRASLFVEEMRHFLAAQRREVEPSVSFADGVATLRLARAVLDSLESGGLVRLD